MSGRWIVACACLAMAGCGSEQQLEPATAGALSEDVAAIRAAAREGDRPGALEAIERLRDRIDRAEDDGELDDAEAAALRQGVRRAERRVGHEVAESAATATPDDPATGEPPPPPAELDEEADPPEGGEPGTGNDEHRGKGETEGKGKGNGKADEGKGDDDGEGED
jgi:hypothetical protein